MTKALKVRAFTLTFIMTFLLTSLSLFADTVNASQDQQAKRDLTNHVYQEMSQEQYAVDGGGYLKGTDLFEGDANKGYDLNEDEFNTLTSAAQTQVVEDIAEASYDAVEVKDNVSDSTVQNWWKELQTKDGVGSKFLNEILKNTKPDFVSANKIYQPFSGLVGTLMGLGAVITLALLGLVTVADILYITIPPFRMMVADKEDTRGGKPVKSKIFSHAALYAVETSENMQTGKGTALGIYLKKRIFELIILGICLMYLVQGQIYVFVGRILDLLQGFLGF